MSQTDGHVVLVQLSVAPERLEEFMPLMLANAAASLRDEDGCRQFDVSAVSDNSAEVLLYEVYDNAEAFAAHLRSAHFLEFDRATTTMVLHKTVTTASRLSGPA